MKQNYRQAKRQKELARKARQQEKHQKRVTKVDGEAGADGAAVPEAAPVDGPAVTTPTGPADGTGAA